MSDKIAIIVREVNCVDVSTHNEAGWDVIYNYFARCPSSELNAPMSDRMELARLDEKIVKLIQKQPVQVSEEKVAITKETKICLVCRGVVFGFSYICKCGANYCENCARALTNLENVCWACDDPIDYSKPVKKFMEEGKTFRVQKKTKKK